MAGHEQLNMSDDRLRELERRFSESGSVDDEAAYLSELVRVGDLPREQLELASYCGHPAARQALGEGPWKRIESTDEWLDWVRGLRAWGHVTCVRAFAAAYRDVALPLVEVDPALKGSPFLTWAEQMVGRIEAWLDEPNPEKLEALVEGDDRCRVVMEDPAGNLMGLPGGWDALSAAVRSALAPTIPHRDSKSA